MIADAERYRAEDAPLRQERRRPQRTGRRRPSGGAPLRSLGDDVPAHERARAEMLVADARQAVKDSAPLDRVRSLTGELQQIYHALVAMPRRRGGPKPAGRGWVIGRLGRRTMT